MLSTGSHHQRRSALTLNKRHQGSGRLCRSHFTSSDDDKDDKDESRPRTKTQTSEILTKSRLTSDSVSFTRQSISYAALPAHPTRLFFLFLQFFFAACVTKQQRKKNINQTSCKTQNQELGDDKTRRRSGHVHHN